MSGYKDLKIILIGAVFGILLSTSPVSAKWLSGKTDIMQLPLTTINGDETNLKSFGGDVILVVNVASNCGFAQQFGSLEKVYETYKKHGFTVVAFPSNDFLDQEPRSNDEIVKYLGDTWGVTFPLMEKTHVRFKDVHPLFSYLTKESPFPGPISWNFNKFLINRRGEVVARYGSRVDPESNEIRSEIEKLLETDTASAEK